MNRRAFFSGEPARTQEKGDDRIVFYGYLKIHFGAPRILIGHLFGEAPGRKAATHLPGEKAVATFGVLFDPAHIRCLLTDAREQR